MSVSIIRHVTWVGFWVNAVLMVIKIAIGHYGHSDALVADGVHSLSDFATDLIVLSFVGIAYKGADSEHPYGHGKFETFASLLIAVILVIVAVGLGWSGVRAIISSLQGNPLPRPDIWTIVVALIAILSKEWLYRYTIATGKRIDSSSLIANAWHHRSDAISSVATRIGVSAGYFLGEGWRIADPVVSIIIAFFIAGSAIEIGRPSVDELLERSLPKDKIREIEEAVAAVPGVKDYHRLRTRRNGHSYLAELHIKVDPNITVTQGHAISTLVETSLRSLLGEDSIITVHVEPYRNSGALQE